LLGEIVDNSFSETEDVSAEPSGPKAGAAKGGAKRRPQRSGYDSGAPRPKRADEFAASGKTPDYKNYEQLRRYVSSQGKILPRRRSGLSAKNQRLVARAIKRARHLALLPMPGTLNK
jgi:small subunit ribosomal protein S18